MRPPMRVGTAARLGLRMPGPRLRRPLPDPMSPAEFEEFKRRWRAESGHVGQSWVKVLDPRAPTTAPSAPRSSITCTKVQHHLHQPSVGRYVILASAGLAAVLL